MERDGIEVNMASVQAADDTVSDMMKAITVSLGKMSRRVAPLNLRTDAGIARLLFEDLGIPPPRPKNRSKILNPKP
jgi:DNA polymerase I-like protein with 3'-5' exonuclease and polymerase domains